MMRFLKPNAAFFFKILQVLAPQEKTIKNFAAQIKNTYKNSENSVTANESPNAFEKKITLSIIITTYNHPHALKAVLTKLQEQTDTNFEIIIADDGSTVETQKIIEAYREKYFPNLQHVWQKDEGFRAARIRNLAIQAAKGSYIIFLDGDCLPRRNFVAWHKKLAEKNYLVAGNRVLISQDFTNKLLANPIKIWPFNLVNGFKWWLQGKINSWFRLWQFPGNYWRKYISRGWQEAKTCNLAIWKKDLLKVNGFEENYQGWGYEDSDLVIRLLRSGLKIKSGRFATTVLHLWHPENDRSQTQKNLSKLQQIMTASTIKAVKGLSSDENNESSRNE